MHTVKINVFDKEDNLLTDYTLELVAESKGEIYSTVTDFCELCDRMLIPNTVDHMNVSYFKDGAFDGAETLTQNLTTGWI